MIFALTNEFKDAMAKNIFFLKKGRFNPSVDQMAYSSLAKGPHFIDYK